MTGREQVQLNELGYVVLERFMDSDYLAAVRQRVDELFEAEGENAGSEFRQEEQTRRLANLVDKHEVFRRAVAVPEIVDLVEGIIGPQWKLSSLNVRSANPFSTWTQPLHADMGAIADERGYWVANSVWMLDDFTEDNGALRIVPGSHRLGKLPQDVLPDPHARHPDEILVTGPAGTVVVMNAHMWHGGTANRTVGHRRAMHGFYCRRDKPQQQYQKQLLSAATKALLDARQRWALALDDPLNDELSRTGSGKSGFLK